MLFLNNFQRWVIVNETELKLIKSNESLIWKYLLPKIIDELIINDSNGYSPKSSPWKYWRPWKYRKSTNDSINFSPIIIDELIINESSTHSPWKLLTIIINATNSSIDLLPIIVDELKLKINESNLYLSWKYSLPIVVDKLLTINESNRHPLWKYITNGSINLLPPARFADVELIINESNKSNRHLLYRPPLLWKFITRVSIDSLTIVNESIYVKGWRRVYARRNDTFYLGPHFISTIYSINTSSGNLLWNTLIIVHACLQ